MKSQKNNNSFNSFYFQICLIVLVFFVAFNSRAELPSCASLPDGTPAQIGVNCLYYGLPQCKDVSPARHRDNCADLIDLPLCSDIQSSPKAGKNCVELCSHQSYSNPDPGASPPLVRGEDFAIFNKQCIRFCDSVEAGIVADPGVNCASRSCHQVLPGVTPVPGSNCNILKCDLLAPDELNKSKFNDASKKYCDGNTKCYNFSSAQLPYVRLRAQNPTCQIHDCKPGLDSCGPDDTLNISNQGDEYVADYSKYAYGGFDISSPAICKAVDCRSPVTVQYRCTDQAGRITGDAVQDIKRNNNCDASGAGAVCSPNYCFETVDCNIEYNKLNRPECAVGSPVDGGSEYNGDPFDSWFYRPKPLDKAVDGNGILLKMHDDLADNRLCYDTNILWDEHRWGWEWDFGLLGSAWFHATLADDSRSPGPCNEGWGGRYGHRGEGFLYLCGTKGLLYSRPSDYVTYYKGHIRTTFSGSGAKHTITICTRYKNTINFNACGERECAISAAFNDIDSVNCGFDVCKDFEIDDSDPYKCMMSADYANNDKPSECSKNIDDYVRNRIVKYDDKICAFLDAKGHLAYEGGFTKGDATLNDGKTCISDSTGSAPCDGYNSNSDEGLADRWREIMKLDYIQNNRPEADGVRGYLDKKGKFFPEQECPKVTLRVAPPDLYNLANPVNSPKLFTPPLYIKNAVMIRGGDDSIPQEGQVYGLTDFHYPEIRVQFGITSARMSLALNEDSGADGAVGPVVLDPSSPAYTTLSTTNYGRQYSAEVFVKKEYDSIEKRPLFCLYRKLKDANGLYIQPFKVGCVYRKLPDIDNKKLRIAIPSTPVRKVMSYIDPDSVAQNPKIALRYITSFGGNKKFDKCSLDDTCSKETLLSNPDPEKDSCLQGAESYKLCSRREECSKIFIECVQNEVNYGVALSKGESTSRYESVRKSCNNNLIPHCNEKKGIYDAEASDVYQEVISGPKKGDPKHYGWFNEICISSGFESKLRNVVAYSIQDSKLGKCIVSPLSPYMTDGDPSTNCDDGGLAPNCLCIEAVKGYRTSQGEVIRKETPREAGLCAEIKKPKLCLPIDYNPIPNPNDPDDPEYIKQSLGKSSYGNDTKVHMTHKYRTQGKPSPDEIKLAGHAEFSAAFAGVPGVRGVCKGFWTYAKNADLVTLYPKMNCLDVGGGAPKWDYAGIENPCVRYSCPSIATFGPDRNGEYQGNYAPGESGEEKGNYHGFALWNKYTKTNDFVEDVRAIGCIAGFKALNSTPIIDQDGKVTGYRGGDFPTRPCDQLGNWSAAKDHCQRIKCEAINPETPRDARDVAAWSQWFDSGGAVFPEVLASRSSSRTQIESIATGSCNNDLGFFQSPGGGPPTRECDYLGNWLKVKNPCVSNCDAITDDLVAKTEVNGFAKWKDAVGVMNVGGIEGEFTSCASGHVTYPYPPIYDLEHKRLENADDLNRPAQKPRRLCKTGLTKSGAQVSVWAKPINACISLCPGSDYDDRIGVGRTIHKSSIGNLTLKWPSTKFGEYAYVTNWIGEEANFNAGYFFKGRTNRYYLMRRYCNVNGKWSDPEPLCAANTGQLGKATYNKGGALPGYKNSVAVGSGEEAAGACILNHWSSGDGKDPLPKRKCVFDNEEKLIDKVHLELSSSTKDCEPKRCGARPAFNGTRGNIPATDKWYAAKEQIIGSCNKWHTAIGVKPNIYCKDSGEWSDVQNEANCKRNCLPQNTPDYFDINVNRWGCGDGTFYNVWTPGLQHGSSLLYSLTDTCGGDCTSYVTGMYCNDGIVSMSTRFLYMDNYCRSAVYNGPQNIIGDGGVGVIESKDTLILHQSYIDHGGNAIHSMDVALRRIMGGAYRPGADIITWGQWD